MAYFIPSSIQKRLLRYALLRTGFLDTATLDLDNLDITLGKRNKIELRNVGILVDRLTALLHLPPELQIITARALLLRIVVPADLYHSPIVADVVGIDLRLGLDVSHPESDPQASRKRRTGSTRSPPHRKANRRIQSSPPFDPGGKLRPDGSTVPTTEDLAKSFLLEEPLAEKRELEALYTSQARQLDESVLSESSEETPVGTGTTIGLPNFLAGFLQGIVDRFEFNIREVFAVLDVKLPKSLGAKPAEPGVDRFSLVLRIGEVDLHGITGADGNATSDDSPRPVNKEQDRPKKQSHSGKRCFSLRDLRVELLTEAKTHDLVKNATLSSQGDELRTACDEPESAPMSGSSPSSSGFSPPSNHASIWEHEAALAPPSAFHHDQSLHSREQHPGLADSMLSLGSSRYDDADEDTSSPPYFRPDPLDIRLGEDNVSWTSRRNLSQGGSGDVWTSFTDPEPLSASDTLASGTLPDSDTSKGQPDHDPSPHGGSVQSTSPGDGPTDDLTQSIMYSHTEAESMYMSAHTERPAMSPDLRRLPGNWNFGEESVDQLDEHLLSGNNDLGVNKVNLEDDDAATTPRARSPVRVSRLVSPEGSNVDRTDAVKLDAFGTTSKEAKIMPGEDAAESRIAKALLSIDEVSVWLPQTGQDVTNVPTTASPPGATSRHRRSSSSTSRSTPRMPGAFSQHADQSASARFDASYMKDTGVLPPATVNAMSSDRAVEANFGILSAQLDGTTSLFLFKALQALKSAFAPRSSTSEGGPAGSSVSSARSSLALDLHFAALHLDLLEALPEKLFSSAFTRVDAPMHHMKSLLHCKMYEIKAGVSLQNGPPNIELDVGKFMFGLGERNVVSFQQTRDEKLASLRSDVSFHVFTPLQTTADKPAPQVTVNTQCVSLDVDLPKLDETFDSFGGISGIVELSASLMSSGTMVSPTLPPKKGVRFEGASKPSDPRDFKLSARLGGVNVRLADRSRSVSLQSTAIKLLMRSAYIAVAVNKIDLLGPCPLVKMAPPPLSVVLSGIRVEYFFTARNEDLEHLVSLLTPSMNKYENDDDILLDTLLRQRRKGAVLQLRINTVQSDVADLNCIRQLQEFGGELKRLSAVTKFLPEDERPGLLTMVTVGGLRAHVPVNGRFGVLAVHFSDFQAAHIGLPALFALAVGSIKARQPDGTDIVHELMPVSADEKLPMVMMRMIGDEAEPTLKAKLFNLCIEYSVPTIMALTGLDATAKVEEVVDLAASIMVDYAGLQATDAPGSPKSGSPVSARAVKKLSVDVLLHDCALGMQPLDQPCKGLFLFNNTRLTTIVPPHQVFDATLELRKASLHVRDKASDAVNDSSTRVLPPTTAAGSGRLLFFLSATGFVSVSSIMSARAQVSITEAADRKSRFVDVEFEDELFLLESCADSTQTLFAILGGLSPPMPPSNEPKFRTEAMTMEDMVSSFSGEAFDRPQDEATTLFDADDPVLSEADDAFPVYADMSESIYAPMDAMFDAGDMTTMPGDSPGEIEQSLLDEDPFEMPNSLRSFRLSDDELLRNLQKQSPAIRATSPVTLKPFYMGVNDLDKSRAASNVLGAPYRFNTPAVAFPVATALQQGEHLPFQLRVRDVHVIWNLYDGYDWQRTRDAITEKVEEVEAKAEERKMRRRRSGTLEDDDEPVIEDCLFNSIYIGVPANRDPQELRREINRGINDLASESESYATSANTRPTNLSSGQQHRPRPKTRRLKLQRSKTHKISFELKGVSADVLVFPPGSGEVQNSVDVRVRDFEIFDNVPTSTWRKFLTYFNDEENMREMMKPMIHIELLNVRPMADLAATEIVMRVSVLPLRLHVDQDALDFMTRFFEFKDEKAKGADNNAEPPFLQRVEINTVTMCLDYKPKKVDYGGLRSGKSTEFMNFFILDKAMIQLRHTIVYGLRGFDALHPTLSSIWTPDVKRNQLPGVLSGLAPVSSLVSIGTGFVDVVAIPIREYKKDGRLVRSIQKGAVHFARNTTSELARFGAKVAVGTQNVLQGAETFLSPGPLALSRRPSDQGWTDVEEEEEPEHRAVSLYADQPLGVLQGLKSARRHLERDLLTARDAFIAVQGEVLESGSAAGAAQAVARHAPTILLRPVIGASRAVSQTLMGVGNQVDRGNMRKMEDKYKRY